MILKWFTSIYLLGIDGEVKGNKQIAYGNKYKIRLEFY